MCGQIYLEEMDLFFSFMSIQNCHVSLVIMYGYQFKMSLRKVCPYICLSLIPFCLMQGYEVWCNGNSDGAGNNARGRH